VLSTKNTIKDIESEHIENPKKLIDFQVVSSANIIIDNPDKIYENFSESQVVLDNVMKELPCVYKETAKAGKKIPLQFESVSIENTVKRNADVQTVKISEEKLSLFCY